MYARDKRFLLAVQRVSCPCSPPTLACTGPDGQTDDRHGWPRLHHHREGFGGGRFAQVSIEPSIWFVPEEETSPPSDAPPARMRLTAHEVSGSTSPEMGFGLDLMLPEVDPACAYGAANRHIGALVALETTPAVADTVQVDLHVQDALGAALDSVFPLAKLRARVLYHANGYYVLRFMPTGWPEAPHSGSPPRDACGAGHAHP